MILNDLTRRWYEVKFYYYCLDVYHIRKDMLDVMGIVEAIAQIGKFNTITIKQLAGKMISDPYYLPLKDELILLCAIQNYTQKEIAKLTGKSQQTISRIIKTKAKIYTPFPRFDIDEDNEIVKFLDLVDIFKKVGI